MRASSMRRLVGGAAALMLVGSMLLAAAGTATAATTRFIYVGPDPSFSDATNYTLSFTPVSAFQTSASTVYVHNLDNQSLTHVVLTFAQTQGSVTIGNIAYGPDGSSCSASGGTLTCDFGNLKAGATRQILLILTAGAAGTQTIHGTIFFNESTNPNGGNTQINDVVGDLVVGPASCNALQTFLAPNLAGDLLPADGTTCATDGQRSGLHVPGTGNGNLVTIDDSALADCTDVGLTCFGYAANATVGNGATISPYLTWFITYTPAVLGNHNPKNVGFVHGTTIIASGKKGACGAIFTKDCLAGYTVNADGSVTFEIHTATNSTMRGF
jgi:hypothetical protein